MLFDNAEIYPKACNRCDASASLTFKSQGSKQLKMSNLRNVCDMLNLIYRKILLAYVQILICRYSFAKVSQFPGGGSPRMFLLQFAWKEKPVQIVFCVERSPLRFLCYNQKWLNIHISGSFVQLLQTFSGGGYLFFNIDAAST